MPELDQCHGELRRESVSTESTTFDSNKRHNFHEHQHRFHERGRGRYMLGQSEDAMVPVD